MANVSNPYSTPSYTDPMLTNSGQPPLASLGKRFLGALVDGVAGIVLVGPGYGLMILGAVNSPNQNEPSALAFIGMGLVIVGALVSIALQLYLLATRSQSLGKLVMKTQIWDVTTGQPAGFVKSFLLRALVNGLICSIPCVGPIYALVDICFIFRDDRRCVHDLLASTVVLDIETR